MTPMGYAGVAVIIGGGWFAIVQLRDLYARGCHTPAIYLTGSVGIIVMGLWIMNRGRAGAEEPEEESEAETNE